MPALHVFHRSKEEVIATVEPWLTDPALVRRLDPNWVIIAPAQTTRTRQLAEDLSRKLETGVFWWEIWKKNVTYILFENGEQMDCFESNSISGYSCFYPDEETESTGFAGLHLEGNPQALLPYCVAHRASEANIWYLLRKIQANREIGGSEEIAPLEYLISCLTEASSDFFFLTYPSGVRDDNILDPVSKYRHFVDEFDGPPTLIASGRFSPEYLHQQLDETALWFWKTEKMPIWLARGADPNGVWPNSDRTVLVDALYSSNLEGVKLLLEAGANPNHCFTMTICLTRDADAIDIVDCTPLIATVCWGRPKQLSQQRAIIQHLLDHGADVHARSADGRTVRDWAFFALQPSYAVNPDDIYADPLIALLESNLRRL